VTAGILFIFCIEIKAYRGFLGLPNARFLAYLPAFLTQKVENSGQRSNSPYILCEKQVWFATLTVSFGWSENNRHMIVYIYWFIITEKFHQHWSTVLQKDLKTREIENDNLAIL